jgi:pimeloyl-ACP methyl ester carboxylesterase
MPTVRANGITMHYERQGSGEPLILIPYLTADHACYAFQVAEYAKHFTCIAVDPRGAGETDKPAGDYTTALVADDVAAFMQALGVDRAHVFGVSLGAAAGLWLAVNHPERVKSLSIHSAWTRTDPFLRTVLAGWQAMAGGLGSVTEMAILGIFPWCFTPELYAARPDYVESLAAFVRGRPVQPLDAFMRQAGAVATHDVASRLGEIAAPTQATFGRFDMLTSTRFAEPLTRGIRGAEVVVLDGCAHAAIYERVEEFNRTTLAFLQRHSG